MYRAGFHFSVHWPDDLRESFNSRLTRSVMVRWTLVQEQSMKYYSTIYVVRMSAIDTKEKKRQRKQWGKMWRRGEQRRRGGERRRDSHETAGGTSGRQTLNREMIARRKVESWSQRALETFSCFDVLRWQTSRTTDKIRVSSLSLSAGKMDVIIYVISGAHRGERKKRQGEDRRQPKTFRLLRWE